MNTNIKKLFEALINDLKNMRYKTIPSKDSLWIVKVHNKYAISRIKTDLITLETLLK